jgi:uncharacterized OsmC-like protein
MSPAAALIVDEAVSEAPDADPCHSVVVPGRGYSVTVPVGVHRGVGGLHDAPNSGELLCAALASCQDTTIRMVADLLGVRIEHLKVTVSGTVDLRGTLQMDPTVRVGFSEMRCDIDLEVDAATDLDRLERLIDAAQYSCVVGDTLCNGVPVETTFTHVDTIPARRA